MICLKTTHEETADDLLRSEEAARLLGVKVRALERARYEYGLPYYKVDERCVLYRRGDVIAFASQQRRRESRNGSRAR